MSVIITIMVDTNVSCIIMAKDLARGVEAKSVAIMKSQYLCLLMIVGSISQSVKFGIALQRVVQRFRI